MSKETSPTPQPEPEPEWVAIAKKQIASLKFGYVQLVVQDSKVVEIETKAKVRFDKPGRLPSGPGK
jgi:hypothetical protein